MRYNFYDVFEESSNGMLKPKRPVRIGGVTMGTGVSFGPGASFAGINIFQMKGIDIEANEENGMLVIGGFFN